MTKQQKPLYLMRANKEILAHVCMTHVPSHGIYKHELQLFEPIILQSGDELLVCADDTAWLNVGGSLWAVRLFSVAIHVDRVLSWARAKTDDERAVEASCNMYPFLRALYAGDMVRLNCREEMLNTPPCGKTTKIAPGLFKEWLDNAQVMPSLFSKTEWQASVEIVSGKSSAPIRSIWSL